MAFWDTCSAVTVVFFTPQAQGMWKTLFMSLCPSWDLKAKK